jgi:hypothetical protein
MKKRALLTGILSVAISWTTIPTAAHAANEDAGIVGVSSQPARPCPYEHVCLYTEESHQGRMFALYECKEYTLYNWDGYGTFVNNNSGGAKAWLRNQDHSNYLTTSPDSLVFDDFIIDFRPIWYVKAC